MLDVMFYSDLIRDRVLLEESLKEADFIFRMDFEDLRWTDFDFKDKILYKGRDIFAQNIEELRKKIRRAKMRSFFHFFN